MPYLAFLVGLILIYWVAACGCALAWRVYEIPLLCCATAFGVGAYVAAQLDLLSATWLIGIVAAGVAGSAFGWLLGSAIARMDRDLGVVVSMAVQAIGGLLILNLTSLTGGPMGRVGISPLMAAQFSGRELTATGLLVIICSPVLFLVSRMWRGTFGVAARAAATNSFLFSSLGYDPKVACRRLFVASFGLLGIAGGLYAHYMTYLHPDSFTLNESILLLCMVVFGARGGVLWTGFGVALFVLLPEALRFLAIDAGSAAKLRAVGLGLVLASAAVLLARSGRHEK